MILLVVLARLLGPIVAAQPVVAAEPSRPALDDARPVLEQIEADDARILAMDQELETLAARASALEAARRQHAAQAADQRSRLDRGRAGVRTLVRAYYKLSRHGIGRLLFDAEDPAELRRRVHALLSVLTAHQERTLAYAALVAEHTASDAKATEEARALEELRADLVRRRTDLDTERQRRVALLGALRSNQRLASRAVVEIAQAQSDLTVAVQSRDVAVPAGDSAAFRAARGRLPKPVVATILHPYGPYADPLSGGTATNLGVDYAAPAGTPFKAVFDGVVARSGYVRGYGQVVMVQHGAYTTLYAHANGLRVAEGQSVRQGDTLGLVGTTGLVGDDAPQLHFELRYYGTPQDPAGWLAP